MARAVAFAAALALVLLALARISRRTAPHIPSFGTQAARAQHAQRAMQPAQQVVQEQLQVHVADRRMLSLLQQPSVLPQQSTGPDTVLAVSHSKDSTRRQTSSSGFQSPAPDAAAPTLRIQAQQPAATAGQRSQATAQLFAALLAQQLSTDIATLVRVAQSSAANHQAPPAAKQQHAPAAAPQGAASSGPRADSMAPAGTAAAQNAPSSAPNAAPMAMPASSNDALAAAPTRAAGVGSSVRLDAAPTSSGMPPVPVQITTDAPVTIGGGLQQAAAPPTAAPQPAAPTRAPTLQAAAQSGAWAAAPPTVAASAGPPVATAAPAAGAAVTAPPVAASAGPSAATVAAPAAAAAVTAAAPGTTTPSIDGSGITVATSTPVVVNAPISVSTPLSQTSVQGAGGGLEGLALVAVAASALLPRFVVVPVFVG